MVIMKMKLDNVLAFKNFEVNFSYPQKLKRSLIQNEYLCNYSNFRYKKANIFCGSNASGVTSIIFSTLKNELVNKDNLVISLFTYKLQLPPINCQILQLTPNLHISPIACKLSVVHNVNHK